MALLPALKPACSAIMLSAYAFSLDSMICSSTLLGWLIKDIRRDAVLEAVAAHRPDLLAFCVSAYGAPSQLWLADGRQVISDEGVQQRDPLGPLLFRIALNQPLKRTGAEFISGYLDDVGLDDTVPQLVDQIRQLEAAAGKVGLSLNHESARSSAFLRPLGR